MRVKKGDKVMVLKGKDRGKTGAVMAVDSKTGLIKVDGLNIYKRHLRRSTGGRVATGGITEIIAPMKPGNLMLVCPNCNKPTRVGIQVTQSGKHRVCKHCKQVLDNVKS